MKFVILRVLTHSELGMFHEYRRQGKEGSKQRAVNFDSDVVDRVFPTALDNDRIPLSLVYDTDTGPQTKAHWLARQGKNWRLEGNCPQDRLYAFVEKGCLFAMEVDASRAVATGAWVVLPKDDPATRLVLADGATSRLTTAGMIALHGEEGDRVREALSELRPDMFAPPDHKTPTTAAPAAPGPGGKHLPPRPQRLAEIIGGTGHSLSSAVADIVDNSVGAEATEIDITFSEPNGGHGRWLSVVDNGWGMTEAELDEAMTLGSEVSYDENSLGKFGYGLKGASWSQARLFTVVSRKRDGVISHLTWDKNNLGDWLATNEPLEAWEADATRLGEQGTAVLWKDMKPPMTGPAVPGTSPYSAEIIDLDRHLALVFHRFIEGRVVGRRKVTIRINGKAVEPNNPVGHRLVDPYDTKSIRVPTTTTDEIVTVQPFVMPSEDEIRQHHRQQGPEAVNDALARTGLYGKRNESQGLFIYRNDRLIKWGGWHQMWSTNDEKTKLARVIVSFGSKLDTLFDINITKRSVNLPSFLQEEIKKLAAPARKASQAKYSRKNVPAPAPPSGPSVTQPPGPAAPEDGASAPSPTGGGGGEGGTPIGTPSPSPAPVLGPVGPATPPPTGSPPPRPAVTLKPVTTALFAWKNAQNLTGGRDLQISGRLPELQALAGRLAGDPEGVADLAAFLGLLDARGLQEHLLRGDEEG